MSSSARPRRVQKEPLLNGHTRRPINAPFYYAPGTQMRTRDIAIAYDVLYWVGLAMALIGLVLGAIAVGKFNNGTGSFRVTGTFDSSQTTFTHPIEPTCDECRADAGLQQNFRKACDHCAYPVTQADVNTTKAHYDTSRCDVIVVGSGPGGAAHAYTLAKSQPTKKICLLEAGKDDVNNPDAHIDNPCYPDTIFPGFPCNMSKPQGRVPWGRILRGISVEWPSGLGDGCYYWPTNIDSPTDVPQFNPPVSYPIGSTLGGTSAVNFAIWQRGTKGVYDQWCNLLNDTKWCFDNINDVFKRIENRGQRDAIAGPKTCDGTFRSLFEPGFLIFPDPAVGITGGILSEAICPFGYLSCEGDLLTAVRPECAASGCLTGLSQCLPELGSLACQARINPRCPTSPGDYGTLDTSFQSKTGPLAVSTPSHDNYLFNGVRNVLNSQFPGRFQALKNFEDPAFDEIIAAASRTYYEGLGNDPDDPNGSFAAILGGLPGLDYMKNFAPWPAGTGKNSDGELVGSSDFTQGNITRNVPVGTEMWKLVFGLSSQATPLLLQRSYAHTAYILPFANLPNTEVITEAYVTRLLFDDEERAGGDHRRIVGVEYANHFNVLKTGRNNNVQGCTAAEAMQNTMSAPRIKLYASTDVVLAAGVINTPAILQRSGIGERQHLNGLDQPIPCRVENRGVGRHIHDHAQLFATWRDGRNISDASTDIFACAIASAANPAFPLIRFKSSPAQNFSNAHFLMAPIPPGETNFLETINQHGLEWAQRLSVRTPQPGQPALHYPPATEDDAGALSAPTPIFNANIGIIEMQQSRSQGTCLIRSDNPFEPPSFNSGILNHPQDLQDMIDAFKNFAMPLIEGLATQTVSQECVLPGVVLERPGAPTGPAQFTEWIYPPVDSFKTDYDDPITNTTRTLFDESKFRKFLETNQRTTWHGTSSCKMGVETDMDAVTDTSGRVYGTKGLRIASLSVAPVSPDANTQAAAYMIGVNMADKAAENYAAAGI